MCPICLSMYCKSKRFVVGSLSINCRKASALSLELGIRETSSKCGIMSTVNTVSGSSLEKKLHKCCTLVFGIKKIYFNHNYILQK